MHSVCLVRKIHRGNRDRNGSGMRTGNHSNKTTDNSRYHVAKLASCRLRHMNVPLSLRQEHLPETAMTQNQRKGCERYGEMDDRPCGSIVGAGHFLLCPRCNAGQLSDETDDAGQKRGGGPGL